MRRSTSNGMMIGPVQILQMYEFLRWRCQFLRQITTPAGFSQSDLELRLVEIVRDPANAHPDYLLKDT